MPHRTAAGANVPLSHMSRAMLLESLRAPGEGFYLQQVVVELDGPLNAERLH